MHPPCPTRPSAGLWGHVAAPLYRPRNFTDRVQFSPTQLVVWLVLVVIVQVLDYFVPLLGAKYSGVLDYFVPLLGAKYSGGSRWGERGCLAGTLVGLFFMPWGIILGPFLGAFIGELLGGRETKEALRSGLGSLVGFLLGTVVKCALCGYFLWKFVEAVW